MKVKKTIADGPKGLTSLRSLFRVSIGCFRSPIRLLALIRGPYAAYSPASFSEASLPFFPVSLIPKLSVESHRPVKTECQSLSFLAATIRARNSHAWSALQGRFLRALTFDREGNEPVDRDIK